MRESIFKFKQFTIKNELSEMKVGTDGVLLGAWCQCGNKPINVLDIGAGTGLISLMIAQRAKLARIIGVEIDSIAASEAQFNVNSSPWTDRISILNHDIAKYSKSCSERFDLIVSNPPFFDNGIIAPKSARAMARHTLSLTIEHLFESASNLLNDDGHFAVVYPYEFLQKLIDAAASYNLSLSKQTDIYTIINSEIPKRVLCEFKHEGVKLEHNKLVIELARHQYSQDYINLTKDFYLKM